MTASLPYVVIVSDGSSIRMIHAPAFGPDLPQLDAIVRRALEPPGSSATSNPPKPSPKPAPAAASAAIHATAPKPIPATTAGMMTQREIALTQNYTGDACQTCQQFKMRQDGKCTRCDSCGSTSGGCS